MTNLKEISLWIKSNLPLIFFVIIGGYYVIPPHNFPIHDFGNYAMKIQSVNAQNGEISDNQVYYQNEQLTFDHSNKQKSIIINGNEIVFLSDKNRGIGFYELRKIEVKSEQ